MVEIDLEKETLAREESENISSLREERQRTGRYVAVGTAISLSLLGLYQAVVSGTPQYAALFAPALIMFIYILWILNASANQRKQLLASAAASRMCDPDATIDVGMDQPRAGHKLDKHATHGTHASKKHAMTAAPMTNDKMATDKEMAANEEKEVADSKDEYSLCPYDETRFYSRSYSIA